MKVRKILLLRSVFWNLMFLQQIEVNVSIDIYLYKCIIINIFENILLECKICFKNRGYF